MNPTIDDAALIEFYNRKSADHDNLRAVLKTQVSSTSSIYYEKQRQGVSLIEFLGLITYVSVGMAAVFNLGLLGGLFCFLVAVLWSFGIRSAGMHPGKIRFLTQLIWGIIMPAYCLLADPYFFATMQNGRPTEFSSHIAIPAYLGHVYLFSLIAISMYLKPQSYRVVHAFVAGALMGCGLLFFLLGFCLIPATLLGLLALVGIVGISPVITGFVLVQSALMHFRWADNVKPSIRILVWWVGLFGTIGLWLGLVSAAGNGAFDLIYESLLPA